jgi:hypothetical protein
MKDFLVFFEPDWRKVPLIFRSLILAGIILIAMAWLGDHWNEQQQYRLPLFESNEKGFEAGIWLIIVALVLLVGVQLLSLGLLWGKILILRWKYSAKKLNQKYYLVTFQSAIYLLDTESKRRFHLKTPQTVNDLGFSLLPWTKIPDDANPTEATTRDSVGNTISWNEYTDYPGGIFTRN